MKAAERIPLIKEIATALASIKSDTERDLTLSQFSFRVPNYWQPTFEARYNVAISVLNRRRNDAALLELHRYLNPANADPSQPASEQPGPWRGENTFRLFISHTHPNAKFVGKVRDVLSRWRVECFVAHVDIKPSEKWLEVIESALLTCHAAAALLTPDFRESIWCDQEVGFCLARSIVVVPLMADDPPHGFLGRFQAVKIDPKLRLMSARATAVGVFETLAKRPEIANRMAPCVVRRYSTSNSYDNTRAAFAAMQEIPKNAWTLELVAEVEEASGRNSQVRDAVVGSAGTGVPEAAQKLLESVKESLGIEPMEVLSNTPAQ